MNALLEATTTNAKIKKGQYVQLVLIYPHAEIPPNWEMPPEDADYEIGQIHESDFYFDDVAPSVGQQIEKHGFAWTIKSLEHYRASENQDIKNAWIAYCTKDGSDAQPYSWDSEPPIMFIALDENLDWVTEGGLNPTFKDDPTAMSDLSNEYQSFQPVTGVCPEYRIYWC